MNQGIVSKIYGAYYSILPAPGYETEKSGQLRGKLRIQKDDPLMRHPVIVGDHVNYTDMEDGTVRIDSLLPRKNFICRSSDYEVHALGANLDLAMLVVSLSHPAPRFGFVDRFLASCHEGNVKPFLLFTKPDLVSDDESSVFEMAALYDRLGYECGIINLLEESKDVILEIKKCIKGVCLVAGNSGTGKSTLINKLLNQEIQKRGIVSDATRKGKHTTTNSFLLKHEDGFLIDTPGIKEWGISGMKREDVIASFPEFQDLHCKFRNCNHEEGIEGCAFQQLISEADNNGIHKMRLKSLIAMLDSLYYSEKIRTGDYIKSTGRFRDPNATVRKEQ